MLDLLPSASCSCPAGWRLGRLRKEFCWLGFSRKAHWGESLAHHVELGLVFVVWSAIFTALSSEELRAMGFGEEGQKSWQESYHKAAALPDTVKRPVVLVANKADRHRVIEIDQLRQMWPGAPLIHTSMLTGTGITELEEQIANLVLAGKTLQSESALITSARHQESLRRAAEHIQTSLVPLREGLPLDFVSIDLRAAYDALGEVTGETASEDLLERIFSEFCIGK